ncbi:MAG TPA: hypothetical protein VE990_16040 [Acidimicrobiales bacterium]|nr:hypothetical protein [Acidimicrobiales bacterium]
MTPAATAVAAVSPGEEVLVRCHDTCAWMPGFVVERVEALASEVGYIVRRHGHPRPLPTPLPARLIRRSPV